MKIGIDFDEIIGGFLDKFLDFYNLKKKKNILYEDIRFYNLCDNFCIGGTEQEAVDLINEFYDSKFFDEIELVKGADKGVNELFKNYSCFIITSRPQKFWEKTDRFFKKYFPDLNPEIIFTGDYENKQKTSKSDICDFLKADILIEDNKDYARNCARKGIEVLLLNRPWNQNFEYKRVTRVWSWKDILKEIKELNETKRSLKNEAKI